VELKEVNIECKCRKPLNNHTENLREKSRMGMELIPGGIVYKNMIMFKFGRTQPLIAGQHTGNLGFFV
jgi:hypothetical protein